MQDQPKYKPQRPSDFFADGRSERQPVEGTIARGALDEDTAFYEGKDAGGQGHRGVSRSRWIKP